MTMPHLLRIGQVSFNPIFWKDGGSLHYKNFFRETLKFTNLLHYGTTLLKSQQILQKIQARIFEDFSLLVFAKFTFVFVKIAEFRKIEKTASFADYLKIAMHL